METEVQKTVLLLEDERSAQSALADVLHANGYTVLAEHNPEWAERTLASRQVHCAVVDLLLPEGAGFAFAEQVRAPERRKRFPLVLLSGVMATPEQRARAEATMGPVMWLARPFSPDQLLRAVQAAMGDRPETTDPGVRQNRRQRARLAYQLKDLGLDAVESGQVETESQVRFRGSALVRGNLRTTPFAEVLAQVHRWKATGALLLRNDRVKKIVYVREGAPLFTRSNLLAECLGKILLREKMISEEECDQSLRRMDETKRQQGTVLIEMGCISPANLAYGLQLQQETKLLEVFSWTEGDYQFNPKAEIPSSPVALHLTPARILLEGIRSYEDARVAEALGSLEGKVVRLSDDPMDRFQDMGLAGDEAAFFAAIDGRKTAAELLLNSPLPFPDAQRLLYALICAHMVQLSSLQRAALAPPPPPPDPAASLPPPPAPQAAPPPPAPPAAQGRRRPQPNVAPPPLPPAAPEPQRPVPPPAPDEGIEGVFSTGRLDRQGQLARLSERAAALRHALAHEVLGIPANASQGEIGAAYARLAREHHPDRLGSEANTQVRALAEEIFSRIHAAYESLHRPTGSRIPRLPHDFSPAPESLPPPPPRDNEAEERVARILRAEEESKKGEKALERREFGKARKHFQVAMELYPEEAAFHASLAWASWKWMPPTQDSAHEALARLDEARRLNPRLDLVYVYRGLIFKEIGQVRAAQSEFENALYCNPACALAERELNLTRRA